jgi:hypothetical protein
LSARSGHLPVANPIDPEILLSIFTPVGCGHAGNRPVPGGALIYSGKPEILVERFKFKKSHASYF